MALISIMKLCAHIYMNEYTQTILSLFLALTFRIWCISGFLWRFLGGKLSHVFAGGLKISPICDILIDRARSRFSILYKLFRGGILRLILTFIQIVYNRFLVLQVFYPRQIYLLYRLLVFIEGSLEYLRTESRVLAASRSAQLFEFDFILIIDVIVYQFNWFCGL